MDDLNQIESIFLKNQLNDLIFDKLSILSIVQYYLKKFSFKKKNAGFFVSLREKKILITLKAKYFQ